MLPEVIADLRANSVIDAAIDSTVTDAIEGLFGDHNLWDALQSSVVGLVGEECSVTRRCKTRSAIRCGRWFPPALMGCPWRCGGCAGRCGGGRVDDELGDR